METIVGTVFALGGLLFLSLAGLMIQRSVRRLHDWKSAFGHVVGYDESNRSGWRYFRPRVEFTDRTGRTVEFAASTSSNRRSYRIGATVRVLFDPAHPAQADLCSFSALWLPAFFFSLFGLTFFGLGIAGIFGWLT